MTPLRGSRLEVQTLVQITNTRMYLRIVEQDMELRFLANDNGVIRTAIMGAVMSMQT